MRRLATLLGLTVALLALAVGTARAEFGLSNFDVTFTDSAGEPATQAGSHPFAMTTSFDVNSHEDADGTFVDAAVRDVEIALPEGLVGSATPVPTCATVDFLNRIAGVPQCPDASTVGNVNVTLGGLGEVDDLGPFAVFNLEPPPGAAMKLGFWVDKVPVTVEAVVNPEPPHNVVGKLTNTSQVVEVLSTQFTLWGNPADPAHDAVRGKCAGEGGGPTGELCPANVPAKPFLTMPRRCEGPLLTTVTATSWADGSPESVPQTFHGSDETDDGAEPPTPLGTTDCASLGFAPRLEARPSTEFASSPTGLEASVEVDDEGLTNPSGLAQSDVKRAVVTLPEGITVNPSVAEGLAVCSPADLERETLAAKPGEGCPEASKIGTVEVETPLLEEEVLHGALYLAAPHDNPFGTLLAVYVVIKHAERGILVKLAGRVEPDPRTGQLVTTFGDPDALDPDFRALPQLPFSDFRLRFRQGGRSPLISPPACGTYETKAVFTPWANPTQTLVTTSDFEVTRGVGGGPCPPPGTPPFAPGFSAGTQNNNAASYSPFSMRLTRADGEQDMTRFSATLPPGLVGRLAGIDKCSDAAIAAARSKDGLAELASPSCPAASQVGTTIAAAGVGSQLTYVPGKLYLAGPVGSNPLSVVAIVPAVAGPFDAGTVVVREALRLNPVTAEVEVDGALSEPIPHILQGIPLKVRDLRVYVDRSEFILNPTSCDPSQVRAQLWGGGLDPFSTADDGPVALTSRFQAANCWLLGFRPGLSLKLKGRHQRGGHPALTATLRPRPGDANLARTVVRFPRATFLDQAHIRTVCTRLQFAADSCPPGAAYGQVTAHTPLLDEPLRGPVYLRSSDNLLPDLVFDLHGLVDIEVAARVDSIKGKLRVTFPAIPDAPVSEVLVEMQGGRKGLLVNSRDICAPVPRASVSLEGHNGKPHVARPALRAVTCKRAARRRRR